MGVLALLCRHGRQRIEVDGQYTNGFGRGETLRALEKGEFDPLIDGAAILEGDAYGPKIYRLRDGRMLKLFRLKRFFSSALLFSYARRFERNCRLLRALGVPCPEIVGQFKVSHLAREAVLYIPLQGETVRSVLRKGATAEESKALRTDLADFVNSLHESGVLFRSLHLGNVVCCSSGGFGLIDVADLSVSRRPLSSWKRARNFAHLARCKEDVSWLNAESDFMQLCADRLHLRRTNDKE